jgi:hypothetical protein
LTAAIRVPACYKTIVVVVFSSINMHKPLPPFGRAARVPAHKRRTSCSATQTCSHVVLHIVQHGQIGEARLMPLSPRSRLTAGPISFLCFSYAFIRTGSPATTYIYRLHNGCQLTTTRCITRHCGASREQPNSKGYLQRSSVASPKHAVYSSHTIIRSNVPSYSL